MSKTEVRVAGERETPTPDCSRLPAGPPARVVAWPGQGGFQRESGRWARTTRYLERIAHDSGAEWADAWAERIEGALGGVA